MEHAESIAPIYGYKIIRGSEVYPPHEGMMWNGLCRGNLSTYPNAFATWSKMEFVHRVVKAQTIQYHSIAVILHPQCSHTSGRNTLSEAKAMVIAGAEIIEIFNGNWESGDDLVVNDHYRTNSTNIENALADGNAESLWDQILSDGLRVWGGGCDDWHGRKKGLVNPPPPSHMWSGNWVWMEILAPKKAGPEILLRRLEQGSFYTTQGVQIVDICVEGDSITVVGDDSVDFIEVIGSEGGPVALGPLNQGDGDSGTLLLKQYGNMVTYTADPTTPYDDIYVRFRLVNTDYQECYYDEHGDGGGDVYAWTQPFFARK